VLRPHFVGKSKRPVGLSTENGGILKVSLAFLITPKCRLGQYSIRKSRLVETRQRIVVDNSSKNPKIAELSMIGLEKGNENVEGN
jgi:hypothetical protein